LSQEKGVKDLLGSRGKTLSNRVWEEGSNARAKADGLIGPAFVIAAVGRGGEDLRRFSKKLKAERTKGDTIPVLLEDGGKPAKGGGT